MLKKLLSFSLRSNVVLVTDFYSALLTNPYDPKSMEETLYLALTLGEDDRVYRMARMNAIVRSNDVHTWGEGFMNAVMHKRQTR